MDRANFIAIFGFFVIFVSLVEPQNPWRTSTTNRPPGESLQDAIDWLNEQVAWLIENQRECRNCCGRLSRLENLTSNYQFRISYLEKLTSDMVLAIESLYRANTTLTNRVNSLESQLRTERNRINEIQMQINSNVLPAIESLRAAVEKLQNVNKIWKNNFKIINQTFQRLREKVTFRWSPFA